MRVSGKSRGKRESVNTNSLGMFDGLWSESVTGRICQELQGKRGLSENERRFLGRIRWKRHLSKWEGEALVALKKRTEDRRALAERMARERGRVQLAEK